MRRTGLLAIVIIALGIGCRAKVIPPPVYTGTSPVMAVPDSVVDIPMAFHLDSLDGTVETRVPRLVGIRGSGWEYPRKPKCNYGIGLRSGFQPGPFATSLDGHQLRLKTRMKYWVRARRRTMPSSSAKSVSSAAISVFGQGLFLRCSLPIGSSLPSQCTNAARNSSPQDITLIVDNAQSRSAGERPVHTFPLSK